MFQKLKEENQKLLDKNLSLEKEIEDLKFQVSASALIISEHESKIEMLKAENKNLLKQINNTSKSSTEINNRLPLVSNVRGTGRKNRSMLEAFLQPNLISKGVIILSIKFLFMTILLAIICIVVVILIFVQYRKKGVVAIILCFVLGGIFCVNILNTPFRRESNMIFSPTTKHVYILNEQKNSIPLPPSTIFKYRSSDTLAAYVSKSSADEISDFYFRLAENGTSLKKGENSAIKILFKYNGDNFVVTIDENDNNSNFTIDIAD